MKFNKKISWILILLFLPVFGFFAYHTKDFKVDASSETLLTQSNKKFIEFQTNYQKFQPEEFILIAFQPSGSTSIFSEANLSRVQAISNELKTIERVKGVNSLVNAPIFYAASSFDSTTSFTDLTWEKQKFSAKFMEKVLASHPIYENLLVSEDQKSMALQLVFKQNQKLLQLEKQMLPIRQKYMNGEPSAEGKKKLAELDKKYDKISEKLNKQRKDEIDRIRKVLEKYDNHGEFYLGGNNLLAYQLIKIIKNDLYVFGIAIVILVSLALLYLFGSLTWVLLAMISCFVCILSTVGLLGFLGLKVTVISAHVISLQIILSLALIIHIIEQFRELADKDDNETPLVELVSEAIRLKAKPCFFAGLTTSIGFGSLIFSGVQPVISFGWMMVLAMAVSVTVCLLFFPSLLVVASRFLVVPKSHSYLKSFMEFFYIICDKAKGFIIFLTLVLCGFGIAGCFLLTAENSFLNYFSKSTKVYKELTFIDKKFGGTTPLDLVYKVPEERRPQDILIPATTIQRIEKLQEHLDKKQAVGSITSVADFTKVAQVVRNKPMSEYELTLFFDILDEDTKRKFLYSYYSPETNELRLAMRIQDSTKGLDRENFMQELEQTLLDFGFKKEETTLTNLFVLYQDILARLVRSQFTTMGIVYAAMFLVLLLIFRSFSVAVIALIPNLVTNLIILGIMGFFGIALDLMTMTITSVAMGISVDDTIHYVHRYLEEMKSSKKPIESTNLSVGFALLYSTLVILTGFSSLTFSEFVPSLLFGALTGLAMILAFLTDLTILPVLMDQFVKKKS